MQKEIPWVEKYRPKKLDDIIQQEETVRILKNAIKTKNLPHLLLYGGPGTGKTSAILACAMQLFGPKMMRDRVIELNASDERGIGIVRNKIKDFAKGAIGRVDEEYKKYYPCPDFKLIILDEADAMTPDAQSALRKMMEDMSNITRFCFICNYINQIIDPIASRCSKLRFKSINQDALLEKLKIISKIENIVLNDECFKTVVEISEGDARRSIMTLQNLKYFDVKTITPKKILEITGNINEDEYKNFLSSCINGNIENIQKLTKKIKTDCYPIHNVLKYINKEILKSELNDNQKSLIFIELAKTDAKITEGCDEYLQMLNILLIINRVANIKT